MLPNEMPVVISGTTHSYTLQSLVDGRSTRRALTDTNLSLPRTLTVAHNTTGKGNKAIDSYLLRLDEVIASETDANSFVQQTNTLSVYLVVKVPRGLADGKAIAKARSSALLVLASATVEGSTAHVMQRVLDGEL